MVTRAIKMLDTKGKDVGKDEIVILTMLISVLGAFPSSHIWRI